MPRAGKLEVGTKLSVVFAAALSMACGGRSGILEPFESEASGGSASASGSGASPSVGGAGQGGTFSTGGSVPVAGSRPIAGMPPVAGMSGVAGGSSCMLSVLDCATPAEPECSGAREPCRGTLACLRSIGSTQLAAVNDVAPGRQRGATITGHHVGTTQFDDRALTSRPSITQPFGQQAFVAALGDSCDVRALYGDPSPTEAGGISVKQANEGDVVLQTAHVYSITATSLIRLSGDLQQRWRQDFGIDPHLRPSSLAVDDDDRIWASGEFTGLLDYPGSTLNSPGTRSGFVLQVESDGLFRRAFAPSPSSWPYGSASTLAVDHERSVLVGGQGDIDPLTQGSYLRKFTSSGQFVFEKLYEGPFQLKKVLVDELSRVTVVGEHQGPFETEGQVFGGQGASNLFLAQYTSEGALVWKKSYGETVVDAAAVDPSGNLLVTGRTSRLVLGAKELTSQHGTELGDPSFGFVLKLRADGTDVWASTMDGQVRWASVSVSHSGQVWLAGSYLKKIWIEDVELESPTTAGLVARLNP